MKKICSIVFVTFLFFFIHLNDVKAEQYENIDCNSSKLLY